MTTETVPSLKVQISSIRDAIEKTEQLPYISGTVAVSLSDLLLFYRKDDESRCLDFTKATDSDIEALAQACDPATFGLGKEDVLDETYRKAGKLDETNFATTLELHSSGLMQALDNRFVSKSWRHARIRAERYKINVYGKDTFFKAHKDTPRSQDMFGSLVVIFPTTHEGGELILRDKGREWTFDSAAAVSAHDGPCVGYVAFYSDVEHEVSVVTSGYRVTLTYNLFWVSSEEPPSIAPSHTARLEAEVAALINNPAFLPLGSYVGFGLQREYPLPRQGGHLTRYFHFLKGADAELFAILQKLSFRPQLNLWFDASEYRENRDGDWYDGVLSDFIPSDEDWTDELYGSSTSDVRLVHDQGGRTVRNLPEHSPLGRDRADEEGESDGEDSNAGDDKSDDDDDVDDFRCEMKVLWISKPATSQYAAARAAYGNCVSLEYAYGNLCLIALVGPFHDRTNLEPVSDAGSNSD